MFFFQGEKYLCGVVSMGPGPPNCGTTPGKYVKIGYPSVSEFILSENRSFAVALNAQMVIVFLLSMIKTVF